MKKLISHIAFALGSFAMMLVISCGKARQHFDERISFRKNDKIPYGGYVAYHHLQYVFPSAEIGINSTAPDQWTYSIKNENNEALIIITPLLFADEYEMKALMDFARKGNDVFISTRELSTAAQNYLRCEISSTNFGAMGTEQKDGLEVRLNLPSDQRPSTFVYPGKRFDSYFFKIDSSVSYECGSSKNENAGSQFQLTDFIRLRIGDGNIFVHLAPICFSNYFLLHHDNINYYNLALSVMPGNRKKVLWDEYYLNKYFNYNVSESGNRPQANDNGNILSGLMSNGSFRGALWLLVIILALLALQEIRRKQRFIPELPPPRNDSLEFVKTIGRLYYEKRDNRNLTRKMASYFLEHVRSRYKLATVNLDEKFINALHMKSGQPEENVRQIISFIHNLDHLENISDKQLTGFHKQLGEFYQNA